MIPIPTVSASTICCPGCRQPVAYRHDGMPEPHWTPDGWLCRASWPHYVTADPGAGGPLPLHAALDMAEEPAA